jgi:two-component system, NtrC family, sensor kinase
VSTQTSFIGQVFDSDVPTAIVDPASMSVLAANPPLAELTGLPLASIVGQPLSLFVSDSGPAPIDLERSRSAIIRREAGDLSVDIVAIYVEREPNPAVVLRFQSRQAAAAPPGNPLENRHLALQRAHRELQAAYNRLEYLNDAVNHRGRELREVYRRLAYASRMAAIGELAAGATHGINNPLAAAVSSNRELSGLLQHLETAAQREQGRTLCTRIDRALTRIEGIVADLRRLAQAGVRRGEIKQADLAREIHLTLELMSHKLRDIALQVDIASGITVRISPDEFSQVIMNLIDNAITAMGGKGSLQIRTKVRGKEVLVEFEDHGPGIAPDIIGKIFEPFFSTKAPDQGSGIGLSVSRSIIEGYAGGLTAESEEGKGARVTIRLPIEVIDEEATHASGG